MTKEEIIAAFHFRHACKEFNPDKKISKSDITFILETARLSPSSFGFEPWRFIVLQQPQRRELLKATSWGAPKKLDTASHFVLGLTMKRPLLQWDSDYIHRFMRDVQGHTEEMCATRLGFYKVFQESDFDLLDDRKMFDWASKQSYIALGNMMTAAALIGIDSCPIEGFKQQETELVLQEQLGVDTSLYGLSYMVAFGYRVVEPKQKTRRPIEDVVTWIE